MSWPDGAACAGADPDLFFPDHAPAGAPVTCESCGRPLRSDNTTGICTANPDCRIEQRRRRRATRTPIGQATAYCDRCPVRAECYKGAVQRGERYGIWGGVDFEQLGRERRRGAARTRRAA